MKLKMNKNVFMNIKKSGIEGRYNEQLSFFNILFFKSESAFGRLKIFLEAMEFKNNFADKLSFLGINLSLLSNFHLLGEKSFEILYIRFNQRKSFNSSK